MFSLFHNIIPNHIQSMTSMIDILFNPDSKLLKKYPRSPLSCKSISCEKETPKKKVQQTNFNSFIISGKHRKFDLLFDIDFVEPQTTVKVFLLSKLGQILKTSSEISTVQLIRNFFNQKQFYRPSVNPLTGFLYFKIDFFCFGKSRSQFNKANKTDWVLKGIDIQKLFTSIKNLQMCQQKLDFKQCETWYGEEQRHRFASVKAIARTIQNQNVFHGISDKQKHVSNELQYSTNFKIQQFQTLFETYNVGNSSVDLKKIRQSFKEVEKVHPHLATFIKNKSRKSNFDPLFVNASTRTKIDDQIKSMLQNKFQITTMKINQQSNQNPNLKFQQLPLNLFQKRKQFFSHLTKNHEYDQIEKYFDSELNLPIQLSFETRCESLQKYLEKNANVISLETKMRILVQIYTFVNVLWQENQMVFLMDPEKTFLTKRLCVKIRGLQNFFKSDKEMMWEELDLINRKRSESILNLSNIFFKLFYKRNLLYTRPRALLTLKRSLLDRCKTMGIDKLNVSNDLPNDVSGKTKQLLTNLNYLFTEQVHAASKTIKKLNRKDLIERRRLEKEDDLLKADDLDGSTDCSDDEDEEEEDSNIEGVLSTKHVACWLLKNI